MNTATPMQLGQLAISMLLLALSVPACDEAVVGREDDQVDTSSDEITLCKELGHEICAKACECGAGDGCLVGTGSPGALSAQIYDDLAHCEGFYVTLACINPANPSSYYQDCLGTTSSCETIVIDAVDRQAAALAESCQNPNGFGIVCGDQQCERSPADVPSNQDCCVAIDGDVSSSTCQAPELACDGPSFGMRLSCDGPEDCGTGSCCGSAIGGFSCIADSACPDGVARLCHRNADCDPGDQCIPASVGGFEFESCANTSP